LRFLRDQTKWVEVKKKIGAFWDTSEGNSAQSRSHMNMAFRCMKWRRLWFTQSTSIASISSSSSIEREKKRENKKEGFSGFWGFLEVQNGMARVSFCFK
jgi:hypothetical protein